MGLTSAGIALAACSSTQVAMPPDDATPEQVVRAYVDAVHAKDCETADALFEDGEGSWCGDIDITSLTVTSQSQERRETTSGAGPVIERVHVQITTRGGDVSMPDGEHMWSYLLDRVGPNKAWRIYDQGVG
ncbi:MAG: DUF4829 domain-containing protein [Micrococcales bacterium]|nr:DUF4829 domain-containing protein [Micrococcales bacterium]